MDDKTNVLAEQIAVPIPNTEYSTVPESAIFNEPPPTENTPAQNSVVEKISSGIGGLFERHGVTWKRGRGRPRGDDEPKKSDIPVDVPKSAVPVGSAASPAGNSRNGDSVLIRRSVTAMAKAATGSIDKVLFRKAKLVTGDQAFARELVNETSATAQECEALAEVTDILMAELGLQSKYLPLAAALTVVGGTGLRYGFAFKTLNELQRKKLQQTAIKP